MRGPQVHPITILDVIQLPVHFIPVFRWNEILTDISQTASLGLHKPQKVNPPTSQVQSHYSILIVNLLVNRVRRTSGDCLVATNRRRLKLTTNSNIITQSIPIAVRVVTGTTIATRVVRGTIASGTKSTIRKNSAVFQGPSGLKASWMRGRR